MNPEISLYIDNSPAKYHILFYIKQGFEPERAIRRGMEEAYEELLEQLFRLTNSNDCIETISQKGNT